MGSPLPPLDCAECHERIDRTKPHIVDGELAWHAAHAPVRHRLGIAGETLPPMSRPPKKPPALPVSMDPEAMRRLRGRR